MTVVWRQDLIGASKGTSGEACLDLILWALVRRRQCAEQYNPTRSLLRRLCLNMIASS
jgi:hypothetical protein